MVFIIKGKNYTNLHGNESFTALWRNIGPLIFAESVTFSHRTHEQWAVWSVP